MVGGAPITEAFAEEIGADGYSDDAASAASLAKKLVAWSDCFVQVWYNMKI